MILSTYQLIGLWLVQSLICLAENPLKDGDIAQEQELYSPAIAREKAQALVRFPHKPVLLSRLNSGTSPLEAKLAQIDLQAKPEHPELNGRLLSEKPVSQVAFAAHKEFITYRPQGYSLVYADLEDNPNPAQYIPRAELEKSVLVLRPMRRFKVPACLNAQETEAYVQTRLAQGIGRWSYWANLHNPEIQATPLKDLRYYDYLDLYAPTRDIVVFSAAELSARRRNDQ